MSNIRGTISVFASVIELSYLPLTVTSLFDKNMIDESEYSKGKYKQLGRKEEQAQEGNSRVRLEMTDKILKMSGNVKKC